jgi:hypothetical protein
MAATLLEDIPDSDAMLIASDDAEDESIDSSPPSDGDELPAGLNSDESPPDDHTNPPSDGDDPHPPSDIDDLNPPSDEDEPQAGQNSVKAPMDNGYGDGDKNEPQTPSNDYSLTLHLMGMNLKLNNPPTKHQWIMAMMMVMRMAMMLRMTMMRTLQQ